eukprot:724293_1
MSVDVCTPLGSLNDIRRVAREAGMTEIQLNKTSRVIAFRGSRHYALYPRINVWYTTGTVGTYLYHPNSEASTQLFRRNVNLLLLKDIFANPRKHTGLGYHFKEELHQRRLPDTSRHGSSRNRSRSRSRSRGHESSTDLDDDEETVAKKQLEHLIIAKEKLEQETQTVREILQTFKEKRKELKRKHEKEEARRKKSANNIRSNQMNPNNKSYWQEIKRKQEEEEKEARRKRSENNNRANQMNPNNQLYWQSRTR